MGTEVIRPQNCLVDRMRDSPVIFQRRKNHYHRKPPLRYEQRRRFGSDELRTAVKNVEIGIEKVNPVRRRGESFDSISNIKVRRSVTNNQLKVSADDIYAGSSIFVVSPAPSSLPLPSFSRKANSHVVVVSVDDSASQDLRRLLRLEF